VIYLAHGASGNAASMAPYVAGLHKRGLAATTVALPVGKAERAIEPYRRQVDDYSNAVIGGQSFGGRVASLLAAEAVPRALVLLSYPLHRPGHHQELRTAHWPSITCPVLLLSGESDPFGRIDLLRDAVRLLPHAQLISYPRVGHGLRAVVEDALDRVAEFARETMQ
jgi:predicted alpha/beta-hydrolase family hydrolase